MSGDDDGARAGREVGDDLIRAEETLLVVGGGELLGEVVRADGTKVASRAVRENVLVASSSSELLCASPGTQTEQTDLGSTGSVLSGTSSDVGNLVVLLDVGVAVRTCATMGKILWRGELAGPAVAA